MSRPIEFRFWDKGLKIMNLQYEYDGRLYIEHGQEIGHCLMNKDRFIALQYTGLKDNNGVKIFEGDIVKCGDKILKVLFSEYEAGFFMYECKLFSLSSPFNPKIEVIGNIYQNPELLENN